MHVQSEAERRSAKRFPGSSLGPLHLRPEPEATPVPATVLDFSIQGIGMLASEAFTSGTTICIHAAHPQRRAPVEAEVRHVTPYGPGRWVLGCRFHRVLTVDDLRELS